MLFMLTANNTSNLITRQENRRKVLAFPAIHEDEFLVTERPKDEEKWAKNEEQNHVKSYSDEDLKKAMDRITELENRLKEVEVKVPRKFPDVVYLNHKDKKRIMVGN